jgi:hypothetical protein
MPPTFVFAMLVALQLCVFLVGASATFLITLVPGARHYRPRMLGGILGLSVGGFLGVVAWYLSIVLTFIVASWMKGSLPPWLSGVAGYVVVGSLIGGYLIGSLVGGRMGWARGASRDASNASVTLRLSEE